MRCEKIERGRSRKSRSRARRKKEKEEDRSVFYAFLIYALSYKAAAQRGARKPDFPNLCFSKAKYDTEVLLRVSRQNHPTSWY